MMSYACRFNWFYKVLKMTKHLVLMFQIILSYEFKGTSLWRDFFTAALTSNLSAKNVGGLNVVLLLSNYHLAMFVTGLSFFLHHWIFRQKRNLKHHLVLLTFEIYNAIFVEQPFEEFALSKKNLSLRIVLKTWLHEKI